MCRIVGGATGHSTAGVAESCAVEPAATDGEPSAARLTGDHRPSVGRRLITTEQPLPRQSSPGKQMAQMRTQDRLAQARMIEEGMRRPMTGTDTQTSQSEK